MKYKLININTKEEHLCDKVTIDGFDYYVSDEFCQDGEWYYIIISNKIEQYDKKLDYGEFHPHKLFCPKVIATNNINIDIHKVVDEVAEIAYNWLYDEETENKASKGYPLKPMEYGFIKGYNKSQETHSFSGVDMIDFYEWCDTSEEAAIFWRRNKVDPDMSGSHWKRIRENREKLLKLWKEQKPKIVYYG